MTVKEAAAAFSKDKRIDFKSRHGDFRGLRILKLVYERKDGKVEVSLVLKSLFSGSEMTAGLDECSISEAVV